MKRNRSLEMRGKKYIVLVIYDVVNNKVRSRLVKYLERYGVRVQKSAFEALLTPKQYMRLCDESHQMIDKETDSLRVYVLDDVLNIYTWGRGSCRESDCVIL